MRGTRLVRLLDSVGGPGLRTRLVVCALLLFLLGWQIGHVEAATVRYTHAEIFAAIRMIESSGREYPPDGDGGRAIGPYQIHMDYWLDSGVEGDYQECRRREYAERVIRAYMRRYIRDAWVRRDAEAIARTHNGGPAGRWKPTTEKYWARVRAQLQKQRL